MTLKEEIQESEEAFQGSSSDDDLEIRSYPDPGSLLLRQRSHAEDLLPLHPGPVHIFKLWQTFLVNVNPLVKIFHAPTVQQIILDGSSDLETIPKPAEALMFGIYLMAIISLRDEECEDTYGESKAALISKYSHATQQALINANYLRSLNITVLQAFTLFLVSINSHSIFPKVVIG